MEPHEVEIILLKREICILQFNKKNNSDSINEIAELKCKIASELEKLEVLQFFKNLTGAIQGIEISESLHYDFDHYKTVMFEKYSDHKKELKIANRDLSYCHWQYILNVNNDVRPQVKLIKEELGDNFENTHRFSKSMKCISKLLSEYKNIPNVMSGIVVPKKDWNEYLNYFNQDLRKDLQIFLITQSKVKY